MCAPNSLSVVIIVHMQLRFAVPKLCPSSEVPQAE
jgi:hypothetical protein